MFCPVCSQEQLGNDTRFCSRCGFLLTGVSNLIASGGAMQGLMSAVPIKMSERKRGVKQGAVLFLSGIMLVPLLGILTVASHAPPFAVGIMALITYLGGVLRMLYALLFESGNVQAADESIIPTFVSKITSGKKTKELLPANAAADLNYNPPIVNWRDTNDLEVPPSVTDETTKLLYRDK